MVKMMNSEFEFAGSVKTGNSGKLTVWQLTGTILKVSGCKPNIIQQSLPFDNSKKRQPHFKLGKEKLTWQHKVDLQDNLQKTIACFMKSLDRP